MTCTFSLHEVDQFRRKARTRWGCRFAIVDGLVKTSAVNYLYAQSDIGTVATHCRIAEDLFIWPDLVHGGPFFLGKYPLGYGPQSTVDLSARRTARAHVPSSKLVRTGEFQFKSHLPLFTFNHQIFWPDFPTDLIAINKINQERRSSFNGHNNLLLMRDRDLHQTAIP